MWCTYLTVLYYIILHCIVVFCIVHHCIALYFIVLYCILLYCISILYIYLNFWKYQKYNISSSIWIRFPPTPTPPPAPAPHFFPRLPIKSEPMDRFWCSRCLNDRINVPDMLEPFSGGATTPLVVKSLTEQPWLNFARLLAILPYSKILL